MPSRSDDVSRYLYGDCKLWNWWWVLTTETLYEAFDGEGVFVDGSVNRTFFSSQFDRFGDGGKRFRDFADRNLVPSAKLS